MTQSRSINIPILKGEEHVAIFPDEFPTDSVPLMDVLQSELAPLQVWRACAVEYHRQGLDSEFASILETIVEAMSDPSVQKLYEENNKEEYNEGAVDIYLAIAAKCLNTLRKASCCTYLTTPEQVSHDSQKIVESIAYVEKKQFIYEYTWLVKGFHELYKGNLKGSEDQFKLVHDRAVKGQNVLKKKYLFGAKVGLGSLAYIHGNYKVALDHFSKAIQFNKEASKDGLYIAISACLFHLEQYDRAQMALDKAIAINPSRSDALVLMSLLEQVSAKKDRQKRPEALQRSLEYGLMAQAFDPQDPQVLLLLARHHFQSWKTVSFKSGCYLLDSTHVAVLNEAIQSTLERNDRIRLNKKSNLQFVKGVEEEKERFSELLIQAVGADTNIDYFSIVELAGPIEIEGLNPPFTVNHLEVKELSKVFNLAKQAISSTSLLLIRSECSYLLAQVFHTQNELDKAYDFYVAATNSNPNFPLPFYGLGQIYMTKGDYKGALSMFENVLSKSPDDKDTQAFVTLLKGVLKNEMCTFEKLRDIAPGFQFEVDLWLVQAQLRQSNPMQHKESLRCYLNALEIIKSSKNANKVPPMVLSNIAVLYHSLGNKFKALELSKEALLTHAQNTKNPVQSQLNPSKSRFKRAEFDGVFYEWVKPGSKGSLKDFWVLLITADKGDGGLSVLDNVLNPHRFRAMNDENLKELLVEGKEIVVGDVKMTVVSIPSESEVICSCPLKLSWLAPYISSSTPHNPSLQENGESPAIPSEVMNRVNAAVEAGEAKLSGLYPIKVKKSLNNFNDQTLTFCYNFARMLEDNGKTKAAQDIYVELLKDHPSYIECYLRLSLISRKNGYLNESSSWLSRALTVSEEEPDATLSLGDLYSQSEIKDVVEGAKKTFEKICNKNHHDARAMISLGNYHYKMIKEKEKILKAQNPTENAKKLIAPSLKECWKFYFHVLNEDIHNAYAANGLGIICAERNEFEAAREIFSKAREANMSVNEDICTNLAHVHNIQRRFLDAELLYQATCRSLSKSNRSFSEDAEYLSSCVASAQFQQGRNQDTRKSLLKVLHWNPNNLNNWFNLGIVGENTGNIVKGGGSNDKKQKNPETGKKISGVTKSTAVEIEDALKQVSLSKKIFKFLHHHLHIFPQNSKNLYFDRKIALKHEQTCGEYFHGMKKQLHVTRALEQQRDLQKQRQQEEHQQRLQLIENEKQVQLQAKEEEKMKAQQLAQEKDKKLQELREKWVSSSTMAAEKKERSKQPGGKKKKDKNLDDTLIDEEEDVLLDSIYGAKPKSALDDLDLDDDISPSKKTKSSQDIDFGSSSSESDSDKNPKTQEKKVKFSANKTKKPLKTAAKSKKTQDEIDIFGSDSDDDFNDVTETKKGDLKRGLEEQDSAAERPKKAPRRVISDDEDEFDADINSASVPTAKVEEQGKGQQKEENTEEMDMDE